MRKCLLLILLLGIYPLQGKEQISPLQQSMKALEEQVLDLIHDQKSAADRYIDFSRAHSKDLKIDRQYEIHRMGGRLILLAAAFGHFKVVKALLKQGTPVDTQTYFGKTALFYAIENRHLDIIKLLLDYGADSTKRNLYNETPVLIAAGWQECVTLLALYSLRP